MGDFDRNIKDAQWIDAEAALPTANGTSYSADFDLGDDVHKPEEIELEVVVPDLTTTHLPDADTLTVGIAAGASANPTTLILAAILVLTGAGAAGSSGPDKVRVRLPADCPRYVRAQFVAAGGTGDISAVDATVQLLF